MQPISVAPGAYLKDREYHISRLRDSAPPFGNEVLNPMRVRRRQRGFLDRWSGDRLSHVWNYMAIGFIGLTIAYGAHIDGQLSKSRDGFISGFDSLLQKTGFGITSISLTGHHKVTEKEILDAININGGISIFAFDTKAAKSRLEHLNWIEKAEILRLLPSKLQVVITEHVPRAVWQHQSAHYLIGRNGDVIGSVERQSYAKFPLVVGDGAARAAAGILKFTQKLEILGPKVKAFVRVADRRWNILFENGVEVLLPEHEAGKAVQDLIELDKKHALVAREIKTIDMRIPDRIAIRLPNEIAEKHKSLIHSDRAPRQLVGRDT